MLLNKDVPYEEKVNFTIYLISRLMANLGNIVYMFAVSYSILYTTGSAFYFSIMSSAVILGPALGGVLFGLFDFYVMIFVFFIAYFISAVLDFFVKFKLYYDEKNYVAEEDLGEAALTKANKFKKDISKGFVYIWGSTILKRVFIMAAIINFFTALLAIYPEKVMIVELGFDPETVGVINAFDGVGALVAGAVLGTIKQINSPIRVMKAGLQLLAVTFMLFLLPIYVSMPQFGTMIFFAAMGFTIAVLVQVINVPFLTYMQVITPQNIKGRVFSVISIFAMSIQPLGTLLYGILYDIIPYWIIHVVSFILLLAAVVISIKEDTIEGAKQQFIAKTAETDEDTPAITSE